MISELIMNEYGNSDDDVDPYLFRDIPDNTKYETKGKKRVYGSDMDRYFNILFHFLRKINTNLSD